MAEPNLTWTLATLGGISNLCWNTVADILNTHVCCFCNFWKCVADPMSIFLCWVSKLLEPMKWVSWPKISWNSHKNSIRSCLTWYHTKMSTLYNSNYSTGISQHQLDLHGPISSIVIAICWTGLGCRCSLDFSRCAFSQVIEMGLKSADSNTAPAFTDTLGFGLAVFCQLLWILTLSLIYMPIINFLFN